MHAFTVLADPVRRRIVEVLAEGERTAGEVVTVVRGEFGIGQSAVSQQLKVLRDHGFARVRPEGVRRFYALEPRAVEAVDSWLEGVRGFWADRLDDLAAEVEGGPRPIVAPARKGASASPALLGPVAQVSRTVRDLAESEAFYGALGLRHLGSSRSATAFDAGGTRLLLTQSRDPAPQESPLTFAVPALDVAVERLRSAGVRLRDPPESAPVALPGPGALFEDPEGRPLALVERPGPV